jgi:hypothetical protein
MGTIVNVNHLQFFVSDGAKKIHIFRKSPSFVGQQIKVNVYKIRKDGRPCRKIGKLIHVVDMCDLEYLKRAKGDS